MVTLTLTINLVHLSLPLTRGERETFSVFLCNGQLDSYIHPASWMTEDLPFVVLVNSSHSRHISIPPIQSIDCPRNPPGMPEPHSGNSVNRQPNYILVTFECELLPIVSVFIASTDIRGTYNWVSQPLGVYSNKENDCGGKVLFVD